MAPERSGHLEEVKNLLPLMQIEPQFNQAVASSLHSLSKPGSLLPITTHYVATAPVVNNLGRVIIGGRVTVASG